METPQIPIILTRIPDVQRRVSSTSQLFTRLDKTTQRESKTSKISRAFPHSIKNHSLNNSKENISYENYLHKVKSALKIDEQKITSKYLLSLRKQYDKMAKSIKMQSTGINVMRKEIQFMKTKLKNQTETSQNAKDKIQSKNKELSSMLVKEEEAKMETKTLQHIILRMKQDQLKQKNDMRLKELELKQKKKQLKVKEEEILQWDHTIHKIFEQMSKIKQEFKKNSEERELKLRDYKSHVYDLEEQEKFELQRKERTYQLLSMESNDILDAKNIVLRDVLLTNKALDKILQCKISDLLNHYQDLQNSYHMIKTETNISDPQLLVKKFFTYSESLEEITSTIGFYEKKQESLIERNKALKEIEKEKITKKLEEDKIIFANSSETQQQKQKLIEQAFEKELEVKKIKAWMQKISSSLFSNKNACEDPQNMQHICEYLLKSMKQVQNQNLSQIKFQSPGIRLKKIVKQISIQDQKLRRSQAQQIFETNLFENAYLTYQRRKVKKNNQFLIKTHGSKMTNK